MIAKIISPKWHAFIDYLLAGSLLVIPSVLKLNKTAKKIYTAEGLILLPYVALTGQPVALEGIIPWEVHQKIDPFNIAQFALQSFTKPFRKDKKALLFNLSFIAIAAATVLLTDWNDKEK